MSTPETREVLQCLYAPRMQQTTRSASTARAESINADPADKPTAQLSNQVLLKQAILMTTFDEAKLVDPLLKAVAVRANDDTRDLSAAVKTLTRGDTKASGEILSRFSVDQVANFATKVLDAEKRLIAQSDEFVKNWQGKQIEGFAQKSKKNIAKAKSAQLMQSGYASVAQFNYALSQKQPIVFAYLQSRDAVSQLDPTFYNASVEYAIPWMAIATPIRQRITERESAIEALRRSATVDPIGYLHLERLQFTPQAARRGDLVYSVTLMPGETVRITERTWSRTEREFTDVVSNMVETESEDTLNERTELSQTSREEQSHQMAFSASLTASGNFGMVSIGTNLGLNLNTQTQRHEEFSSKRSRDLTRRASSRAKKEQKTTFRMLSATETETTNFRELTNNATDAVRWDFHRIVRAWEVSLYRYGIRLTYDLTIPEPGSYLLRHYKEIERLETEIERPPTIPNVTGLTPESWDRWQAMYNMPIEAPPRNVEISGAQVVNYGGANNTLTASTVELIIPDGYYIDDTSCTADPAIDAYKDDNNTRISRTDMLTTRNRGRLHDRKVTGTFSWQFTTWWYHDPNQGAAATASIRATAKPLPQTIETWRNKAFTMLVDTIRARHEETRAELTRKVESIRRYLAQYGTLDLRRLEREELMKGVLRWILGPQFNFYPSDLPQNLQALQAGITSDIESGPDNERFPGLYTATTGAISNREVWQAVLQHGRIIAFLHHAIEWENISYILYPYFWTNHDRWHFKQQLQHVDDQHWQFLRAGAARVVLTIRPGFEEAWMQFADTGEIALVEEGSTPYWPIAQEVKARAQQYEEHAAASGQLQYPGELMDTWQEFTPTDALDVIRGPELVP